MGRSGWRAGWGRDCGGPARVLRKCLMVWSAVAQVAEVRRPGTAESKGPEVNMRTESHSGSCEEVRNMERRESSCISNWISEFEIQKKQKVQEDNGVKFYGSCS